MWIIKLGGSLLRSGHLQQWLSMIVTYGHGKLTIVPGGSIFAEHIRTVQQQWQFTDRSAHNMALLAMEQYAHLLQSYAPQLCLVDCLEDIQKAINAKQLPVWLPSKMLTKRCDIPSNWETSSDSLALCLANELGAQHMMLIKSLTMGNMNARQLSAHAMLDKHFPTLMETTNTNIWWLDYNHINVLQELLKKNAEPAHYLQPIIY